MSNRGNDDLFGLDDLENFGDPSFGEDDIQPTPTRTSGGPRNTRFLLIAILLVIVILLGVVLIIIAAIKQGEDNTRIAQTRAAIETINAEISFKLTQTAIAQSWTKTFTPTPTSTDTPTPTITPSPTETPTITPSITPTFTPSVDMPGTFTAQTATAAIENLTMKPPQLTQTAISQAQTLIALTQTAMAGSATFTPSPTSSEGLGTQVATAASTGEATAESTLPTTPLPAITQVVGGNGTPGSVIVIIQSPIYVIPISPTPRPSDTRTPRPTALSGTGFFDGGVDGIANAGSLPVVLLAAVGLVALIFMSRALRVKA